VIPPFLSENFIFFSFFFRSYSLLFSLFFPFPSDTTVVERQKAKKRKSDVKAYQVHFGNDEACLEAFQKQRNASIE
jgi:hypothetical protein